MLKTLLKPKNAQKIYNNKAANIFQAFQMKKSFCIALNNKRQGAKFLHSYFFLFLLLFLSVFVLIDAFSVFCWTFLSFHFFWTWPLFLGSQFLSMFLSQFFAFINVLVGVLVFSVLAENTHFYTASLFIWLLSFLKWIWNTKLFIIKSGMNESSIFMHSKMTSN